MFSLCEIPFHSSIEQIPEGKNAKMQTTSHQIYLSNEEESVRKNWCILTFILYIFIPVINFTFFQDNEFGVKEVIIFCLLYYCAFLKHGTRLLSLCLFFGFLGIIFYLNFLYYDIFIPIDQNFYLVQIATFLYTLWCILTIRLRKINLKIFHFKNFNKSLFIVYNDLR